MKVAVKQSIYKTSHVINVNCDKLTTVYNITVYSYDALLRKYLMDRIYLFNIPLNLSNICHFHCEINSFLSYSSFNKLTFASILCMRLFFARSSILKLTLKVVCYMAFCQAYVHQTRLSLACSFHENPCFITNVLLKTKQGSCKYFEQFHHFLLMLLLTEFIS